MIHDDTIWLKLGSQRKGTFKRLIVQTFPKEHPDILDDFSKIAGGSYQIKNDVLCYVSSKDKRNKLSMQESSSSVRSLVEMSFYLRHVLQKGDLLMIDEPEMNLHVANQRLLARLFARLINHGIRVLVTTHSDYLIRELNTLIMLGRKSEALQTLVEPLGYKPDECVQASKIHLYMADEMTIKVPGTSKKQKCNTLKRAEIDEKYGIEVTAFDETIRELNRIQDTLLEAIETEEDGSYE